MKDNIVIIKNTDGTCEIVTPIYSMFDSTSRDRIMLAQNNLLNIDASNQEVMDFVISRLDLQNKSYRITTKDKIPQDRTFRDAWTDDFDTDTVDIHVERAHEIKKEAFRQHRKPLLEKLDIDYMKLLEKGEDTSNIIKQKEELRNITKLKLPSNIDELKDFTPDILNPIV